MASAESIVATARAAYDSGRTKPIPWRINQLKRLLDLCMDNHDVLSEAVKKDLHKCDFEYSVAEEDIFRNEIVNTLNNLEKWNKPKHVAKGFVNTLDSLFIRNEPYGVMLVIAPWNYPVQLILKPLSGAIAAGNACVLKPSEISHNVSQVLADLIPKYLDKECFPVILGGIPETTAILEQRFDVIMFTGSKAVGRIVMAAAAKNLTPVILELGGKCPVYVHGDSDLEIVARRVLWAKYMNAGQTCLGPDYLVCQDTITDKLIEKLQEVTKLFYGEDPHKSPDFGRIIADRHYARIAAHLDEMPEEKLVLGNVKIAEEKYISPTIYKNVELCDSIMKEEIFGPILPIMSVKGPEEAIKIFNSYPKALALYIFSKSDEVVEKVMAKSYSGGVTVNDTLMHMISHSLPFGGVGESGMGFYNGKHSFESFSQQRSVCWRKQNFEGLISPRYPPFTEKNQKTLQWLTREKKGGICKIM